MADPIVTEQFKRDLIYTIEVIEKKYGHDSKYCTGLTDYAMNTIWNLHPTTTPHYRDAVDIAVEMGYQKALRPEVRINLGTYLSKYDGLEFAKLTRYANGIPVKVRCYVYSPELKKAITSFFTASLEKLFYTKTPI